jgi:hypothetical protein
LNKVSPFFAEPLRLEFASKNNIQLKQRNVPISGVFNEFPEAF